MKQLAAAALALCLGATGALASVVNGSFEDPGTLNGNWATYGAGSSALVGWDIEAGSIDLINRYWQHSDGNYSINLDGGSPGTIAQTLTGLVVGQRYELSFDMAANTGHRGSTVSLNASVDGTDQDFFFDVAGHSTSDMGWETFTMAFTADATDMRLRFASNSRSGPYGAALDNISVAAVPLPASGIVLLGAIAGLAMARRKRR